MPDVAVAGLPLDYPYSGTWTYLRGLLPHLPLAAPDFTFRVFLRDAYGSPGTAEAIRLSTPLARLNAGAGMGARADKFTWETLSLPIAAAHFGADLLHSPYFAAPPLSSCPVVVSVHDVIPLVLPGYHRGRASDLYARFMAQTVRRAAAIISVSEHSRADIIRVLGIEECRVTVTPEAAEERFCPISQPGEREALRSTYNLPEQFLLYIGGAERRKNVSTLIHAWKNVNTNMSRADVQLVIVANPPPPDPLYPDIVGLARDLELLDTIRFVPFIEEVDKPALYRAALGLCFPSTYEGFGLTPLEAMACGTPVIVSNATSLPEVVGDAGWLLEPEDVQAWADSMLALVQSGQVRAELSRRGAERAGKFSWQAAADRTAAVYREVLNR